jgi:hypothetical protein
MGHRDLATTQCYADYAPNEREVEMVDRAFGTDPGTTSNPGAPTPD